MYQTKITVKIYEPLLVAFDRQLDRLCLKRDAFLNHMIKVETPYLAAEMDGRQLSGAARRYISGSLKKMGTRTVNIVVEKETAAALTRVIEAANMVRDAFINRLIMFLRSSDSMLSYLDLPKHINSSEFDNWFQAVPTSPLLAMEAVFSDPFNYIRLGAEERFKTGLYLLDLPPRLAGFYCFIEDEYVPGTMEHSELIRRSDAIMEELSELESSAFADASSCGDLTSGDQWKERGMK